MKKLLKSLLCIVLCLCTIMPTTAFMSFAAQVTVGKVTSLTLVSKTPSTVKIKWSKVKKASGYQIAFYNRATKKWVVEKNTTALNYTDTKLNELTTYYYKVRAFIKKNGKVTYGKYSPKLTVKTTEAPVVVGRTEPVTVSARTDSTLTIKWPKIANATGYRVYVYSTTQRKWVEEKTVTTPSYTDTALAPGAEYSYRVRAFVKKNGKVTYGKYSSTLKAQTLPSAVTGLKVDDVTVNSITISWDKSRGATEYEVQEYDIYKKQYSTVATVSDTTFTAEGLPSLSTHRYAVKSVAKKSTNVTSSALCDLVIGKTLLATVESIRVTNVKKDRIEIAWDYVNGATEYTISVRNEENGEWKDFVTVKGNSYAFENLKSATEYNIRFRTSSGKEHSEYSQIYRLCSLPETPTNVATGTTSDKGVAVAWSGVEGADGYKIYRSANGANPVLIGTSNTNAYKDTDLSLDTTYKYEVSAYVTVNGVDYESECSEPFEHKYVAATDPKFALDDTKIAAAGLLGYLYDPERDVFYTAKDSWQRNFGFNIAYDVSAQFIFINYNTDRFKFRADGKDWMIQLWKGQYGLVFYGGEVGVYTKAIDAAVEHYDCAADEDMLRMSVNFYFYDKSKEQWVFRFERPYGLYWWCTGFKWGNNGYDFSVYRMDIRITVKSFDMLKGLTASMDEKGYKYTVDGLDVYFTWI